MATTIEADHGTLAEELIDTIEALDNTAAPLRAVYGAFGTFDYERKNLLCAIADEMRLMYQANGVKYTEAQIDQKAHADPRYIARIALATQERTRLALIDAEVIAKQRRYELAKSRVYLSGRLAGLQ
jgi:lipopolysaccharide biosynthesis protein